MNEWMSDWLYCAAGNGTQVLKHDGQALYPWVTLPVAKTTIGEMMPELGEQKLSPLMSWLWLTHWLGCASQPLLCVWWLVFCYFRQCPLPCSLTCWKAIKMIESTRPAWATLRDPGSKTRGTTTATTVTLEGRSSSHLPFSYLSASVLYLMVLRALRSKKEAQTVSSPHCLPGFVLLFRDMISMWKWRVTPNFTDAKTDGKMVQEVRC